MERVNVTDDLLDLPRYFQCERLKGKLRIAVCLGRRKANETKRPFEAMPYPECKDCGQGRGNADAERGDRKARPKPRRGKGKRHSSCPDYSGCLGRAAKRDWKSWNCGHCESGQGGKAVTEKEANTRICENCGEKPTISPGSTLCASCMAKRGNEKRWKKIKAAEARKAKTATQGKGKAEKASRGPNVAVTVDFGRHESILKDVQDLAEREIRTLDEQVVYMLKRFLEVMDGEGT